MLLTSLIVPHSSTSRSYVKPLKFVPYPASPISNLCPRAQLPWGNSSGTRYFPNPYLSISSVSGNFSAGRSHTMREEWCERRGHHKKWTSSIKESVQLLPVRALISKTKMPKVPSLKATCQKNTSCDYWKTRSKRRTRHQNRPKGNTEVGLERKNDVG